MKRALVLLFPLSLALPGCDNSSGKPCSELEPQFDQITEILKLEHTDDWSEVQYPRSIWDAMNIDSKRSEIEAVAKCKANGPAKIIDRMTGKVLASRDLLGRYSIATD